MNAQGEVLEKPTNSEDDTAAPRNEVTTTRGSEEKEEEEEESVLRVMAGGLSGNILEWFDFSVYAAVAGEIGQNFFPDNSKTAQTIGALAVFAGAFVMRPIGGIIFGFIGDKSGRKTSLVLSIMLMAITSFLMGIMPTYSSIGLSASIMLVTLKLFQGLSVGGEMVGSMLFLCEYSPKENRGFYGSTVMASAVIGIALGVAAVAFLRLIFSPQQMLDFGWRIPFICGVGIAAVALWVRFALREPPAFRKLEASGQVADNPVWTALRDHWQLVIMFAGCNALWCSSTWAATAFLPYTYLSNEDLVNEPTPHSGLVSTIFLCLSAVTICSFGVVSDRVGQRTSIMIWGTLFLGLTFPIAFALFNMGTIFYTSLGFVLIILGIGMVGGPLAAWMCEAFPSASRYTAIAMGYNISQACFGGTSPVILTTLAARDRSTWGASPGLYMSAISFFCMSAFFFTNLYRKKVNTTPNEEEVENEAGRCSSQNSRFLAIILFSLMLWTSGKGGTPVVADDIPDEL
tara:strand:- start:215 stop:1759 length:1545 start_codon:yes stop_codon:yes gene_type:complete